MECGSISDPPSSSKKTVWCIVEVVAFVIFGINCLYGFLESGRLSSILSFLAYVGNGFGVAGLILICFALWKENPAVMKIGILCFVVTLILSILIFVFTLFDGVSGSSIIHFILDIFLCIILWTQSNRLSGGN